MDRLDYRGALVVLADGMGGQLGAFYRSLLGDPVRSIGSGYWEFGLTGGLRLGIFRPQPEQMERFQGATGGLCLCLEVVNLDQAIALVSDRGATLAGPVRIASHGREIDAIDPAGNRLILYEPNELANSGIKNS
ncbi:VOC family protein [Limnothrix sp. PR1529]|uniref:VOC family protein n=1 Tax=Limnothrix sp. PR1529 TaxID=1704291 RepID=UPI0018FEA99F|nr:glyoxalase [Limnothrix sp. PR1529]